MLFVSGLIAFLSTFPIFAYSNIFRQTQSRLQTTGGVLLTRVAAIRPVTSAEDKLRQVFDEGGLDARLLYARFGPDVLTNCPFAKTGSLDAGRDYLLYAAPSILAPHMLHLFALAVATSRFLAGAEGSRWRTVATIAGGMLAVAELWLIANYDDRPNARSTRLGEIDFIYWKMQVWRGLAIAAMDGVLGWVIWLQATGRALLRSPPTSERILGHARLLEHVLGKVRGLGIIRNGTVRDGGLRRQVDSYWVKESEVMKDVFEEPEVLQVQNNALRRLDVTRVGHEAEAYLDNILGGVQVIRDPAIT